MAPKRTIQQFDIQLGRSEWITTVGHGPIGTRSSHTPVSVSVTRKLADACATFSAFKEVLIA